MPQTDQIELTQPDDFHLHLRDGALLNTVAPHTARQFARAVVMPNLTPPVVTVKQALDYRDRILKAIPQELSFTPLMALYLTESTSLDEITRAAKSADIIGFKLYPAGATTNSSAGITKIENAYPLFEQMQKVDIPLLIHGEVTDPDVDFFDREKVFIDRYLSNITDSFPNLRVVLEHITTKEAVDFVTESSKSVASTITPQHLLHNRNALFKGGFKPHYFCLPVLKREQHRVALMEAATSGNPKFFLGTDSAPHTAARKENACGCAGCYSAPNAIELYATAFEQAGALHKLEAFSSHFGADFYQLPRNTTKIRLIRKEWQIPSHFTIEGNEQLIPLGADDMINWQIQHSI